MLEILYRSEVEGQGQDHVPLGHDQTNVTYNGGAYISRGHSRPEIPEISKLS